MTRTRIWVVCAVAAVGGVGIAAAAPSDPAPAEASAAALVAEVTLPGQPPSTSGSLIAPPTATGGGPFSYPEDGSVLRVGASKSSVTAQPGLSSSAEAVANVLAVSVFGGEVTAESVDVRAGAAAGPASSTGETGGSSITGLTVLGATVAATPNGQVALGDWGTLNLLSATSTTTDKPRAGEASIVALRIRVVAEHGGLPAGSEIVVGSVNASAQAQEQAPVPTETSETSTETDESPALPAPPRPMASAPDEPGTSRPGGAPPQLVRPAPEVTASLSRGGYVFPVYGPASFGDTFGAYRGDVPGNWHHGEDIVAPLGTPLLAVADGTLFSVGWNDIGGWRLWLRDASGNEFYYAHLVAYSSLARDGAHVKAGDVIGFLGKTGDAEASIPHLHFEIHPVSLLSLGYDGAVAPYPFLVAWRRAEDVSFSDGRRYLPGSGLPVASARAGAVLLRMDDISTSSGLVPGALEHALEGP